MACLFSRRYLGWHGFRSCRRGLALCSTVHRERDADVRASGALAHWNLTRPRPPITARVFFALPPKGQLGGRTVIMRGRAHQHSIFCLITASKPQTNTSGQICLKTTVATDLCALHDFIVLFSTVLLEFCVPHLIDRQPRHRPRSTT